MTWAGFNSSLMCEDSVKPRAIIGVLPLFPDKAASVLMVKHAMYVVTDDTQFMSRGETRPWHGPANTDLSEDTFVLMLGSLHNDFIN